MKLQSYSKKVTASLVLILLVFGVGAISNNITLVHAVGGGGQYKFITKWGSLGTGNGQFQNVGHIVADSKTGNIFVVDQGNKRIQKFDSNGKFITKWGSLGTGNGQFNGTGGIATDANTGSVYVVDTDNNRVQKFDSNGKFITKWGSLGTGNGQFQNAG